MKQETVESEEFEKLMQQDITSNNQKSKKSASKTKI